MYTSRLTTDRVHEHRRVKQLIWSEPIARLAEELRGDASRVKELVGSAPVEPLEKLAQRIEAALAAAVAPDWLPLAFAAERMDLTPDALRARCQRRSIQARKRARAWEMHVSALSGQRPSAA
jgi:hypothetical protein